MRSRYHENQPVVPDTPCPTPLIFCSNVPRPQGIGNVRAGMRFSSGNRERFAPSDLGRHGVSGTGGTGTQARGIRNVRHRGIGNAASWYRSNAYFG